MGFLAAFEKTAVTAAQLTPEEYYALLHEKDAPTGALAGAAAGAAAGARKGKSGGKSRAALIGAGLGAAGGGAVGAVGVGAVRRHQARRLRRVLNELNLRSTSQRLHQERE